MSGRPTLGDRKSGQIRHRHPGFVRKMPPNLGEPSNDARPSHSAGLQRPQQMIGGVGGIAQGALLDEELPGDEQCSNENEREHRSRELTGIVHRTSFSQFRSHEERQSAIASSCVVQINCRFFPAETLPANASVIDLHPQAARIDLIPANALRAAARRDCTGAGIDEIVAADAGAVALCQPFRQAREAALRQ